MIAIEEMGLMEFLSDLFRSLPIGKRRSENERDYRGLNQAIERRRRDALVT